MKYDYKNKRIRVTLKDYLEIREEMLLHYRLFLYAWTGLVIAACAHPVLGIIYGYN